MRALALVSGLFIVVQLSGACATGVTDTDAGFEDDDGGASGPAGSGGMPPSTAVGREPMTASQSGSGGAGTTTTSGGMGGATTTTTTAATTVTTTVTTTATTTTTTTTAATTTTTTGGCTPVDVVTDGGYELGINTPAWSLASTNYGSPVCDIGCGLGGGTGPRTGSFWAWFGGVSLSTEIASTSQTFVIPNGMMATLDFWLEIPACDSVLDIFEVTIDNNLIYAANGADVACGNIGYQLKSINLSAYADGGQHTLMFRGDTLALFFTATNFMVDDVSLTACQ